MSVNVLLEVQSKPENLDEVKSSFESILKVTRKYDGCLGVQIMGNQDDPLNIVLHQTWETRGHYEAYLGWRAETGVIAALSALLSEEAIIRYYDDLDI